MIWYYAPRSHVGLRFAHTVILLVFFFTIIWHFRCFSFFTCFATLSVEFCLFSSPPNPGNTEEKKKISIREWNGWGWPQTHLQPNSLVCWDLLDIYTTCSDSTQLTTHHTTNGVVYSVQSTTQQTHSTIQPPMEIFLFFLVYLSGLFLLLCFGLSWYTCWEL